MNHTATDAMNLNEVAQFAGLSEPQIRAWTTRYGWPHATRVGCGRHGRGHLAYSERQAIQLREIAARLRNGAMISALIVDGQPRLAAAIVPAAHIHLDLSNIPRPHTTAGTETQRLLILGLVQRHPGRIRHALAECARLRPDERGPAVFLVLDAARAQNPTHAAWIDQAVEGV